MAQQRPSGCLPLLIFAVVSCMGLGLALVMGLVGAIRGILGFGRAPSKGPAEQRRSLGRLLHQLVEKDGPCSLEELARSEGGRRHQPRVLKTLEVAEREGLVMLLNDSWIITDEGRAKITED